MADVTPPQALSDFFVALARYKATKRPFIAAVLPVWYSDDNAVLAVSSPDQTARVVLGLTQDRPAAPPRQSPHTCDR